MLKSTLPARSPARAGGFSLVELMVAMVAGLILIGSVLGLVMANLQNNAATVSGMRLTQESRAITEVMTRELRRLRYNGQAIASIGTGSTSSTFETLDIATTGCIKYAYDADSDGVADNGEFRMFSRQVVDGIGRLRYGRFANAGAISCTGGSIISSGDIDITTLTFAAAANRITFSLAMSALVDGEQASVRNTSGAIMLRSGEPVAP